MKNQFGYFSEKIKKPKSAGRPRHNGTVITYIRLPKAINDVMEARAKANNRSRAAEILTTIQRGLDKEIS